VGNLRARKKRPLLSLIRGCLSLVILILILAAAVWIFRLPLLTAAGAALVQAESPRKAQAILVLGGDDYGTRIIKAAQLAREGFAPIVLVSSPPNPISAGCDCHVDYARRNGYSISTFQRVEIPSWVDSTRSEAIFFRKYLNTRDIRDILIVTSNFHTKRAAYLWHQEAPSLRFTMIAAPDLFFTPSTWWKTRNGQKTFLLEWLKTFAARLGD